MHAYVGAARPAERLVLKRARTLKLCGCPMLLYLTGATCSCVCMLVCARACCMYSNCCVCVKCLNSQPLICDFHRCVNRHFRRLASKIRIRVHARTDARTHARTRACMHACTRARMYACKYAYAQVCVEHLVRGASNQCFPRLTVLGGAHPHQRIINDDTHANRCRHRWTHGATHSCRLMPPARLASAPRVRARALRRSSLLRRRSSPSRSLGLPI